MSYNLYLDDIRQPWQTGNYMLPVDLRAAYRLKEWVIVRNYDEFVEYITEHGLPELVSFDHDLALVHYEGGKESFEYYPETGYDCAKWLTDYCIKNNLQLCSYLVHSMNPAGTENIKEHLNNFKNKQHGLF